VSWERQAACRPPDDATNNERYQHTARFYDDQRREKLSFADHPGQRLWLEFCQPCPVRAECLQDAVENEPRFQMFGFRGGMTADDRRRWVRERWKYRQCERCGRPYRDKGRGHLACETAA